MDITQSFYDNMASQYDKLFLDWEATTHEQAEILERIISEHGLDRDARVLDCACGIGTQAIGLAALGYDVTASDISDGELAEARVRAEKNNVRIRFEHVDFRTLSDVFDGDFDVVMAMDNALPHMLTSEDLASAIGSIVRQVRPGGIFIASIRDYDELLEKKPPYSPPYIHKTAEGQRVSFQTWEWEGENYHLVQYIIVVAEQGEAHVAPVVGQLQMLGGNSECVGAGKPHYGNAAHTGRGRDGCNSTHNVTLDCCR